jgi:hypothetical protein
MIVFCDAADDDGGECVEEFRRRDFVERRDGTTFPSLTLKYVLDAFSIDFWSQGTRIHVNPT